MEIIFLALLASAITICFLKLVDKKVEGKYPVLKKIGVLFLLGVCVFLLVTFYGGTILSLSRLKFKSLAKIKQIVFLQIIGIIALLLVFLICILHLLFTRTFKVEKREFNKVNSIKSTCDICYDVDIVPVEENTTIFNAQRVTLKSYSFCLPEGGNN